MTLGNKATQRNQLAFGHQFALRHEILTNSEQSVEKPSGVKALPGGVKRQQLLPAIKPITYRAITVFTDCRTLTMWGTFSTGDGVTDWQWNCYRQDHDEQIK